VAFARVLDLIWEDGVGKQAVMTMFPQGSWLLVPGPGSSGRPLHVAA